MSQILLYRSNLSNLSNLKTSFIEEPHSPSAGLSTARARHRLHRDHRAP
jgi:hypothetical protein